MVKSVDNYQESFERRPFGRDSVPDKHHPRGPVSNFHPTEVGRRFILRAQLRAHTHTSILEGGKDETTVMVGMSAEWNAYAKGSRKWGDLVRRSGFATKWATKRVTGARDRAGTNALGHEAQDGGKGSSKRT